MNNELEIARTAYKDGDYEKAKEEYDRAYRNDPALMEARFFASYCGLVSCQYGRAFDKLMSFSDTAIGAVNDLASKGSDDNVKGLLDSMCDAIAILPATMSKIQLELWKSAPDTEKAKYNEQKKTVEARSIALLFSFGDAVEKHFGEHIAIAARAWKEGVQAFASYPYCGIKKEFRDEYIAKIMKVDPSYQAPKKAGCISFT